MNEAKLQKKYDFFEYYSELIIPKENFKVSSEHKKLIENSNSQSESDELQDKNNLKIENSTFIIKVPETNQILLILSIDKDLPSKIQKNIYSIPFQFPILHAISFMNDSEDESILISTGSENSIDKIEVYQIPIKQLMHEAIYNLLKDIKNSIKIIPIKDSLVLVLHYFTDKYKDGGLKLWKNFKEEIYNFNKIYNFTYNNLNNKIICLDNKQAPFTISLYSFEESYFNKKSNEKLQPEFFISLGEFLKNTKEENIEKFIHFESFHNIIIFFAKTKGEQTGYLFGIFFLNYKEKKCSNYIDFNFDGKNKYLFKINKNTNEIYIFNLSEEILIIYSFKIVSNNLNEDFSPDNLFISKIKFSGNIKGIDFTAHNGMVILTEQNNLVCYSRNENIFKNYQKKYSEIKNQNNQESVQSNQKKHPKSEDKTIFTNNINNLINDIPKEIENLELKKYNSEKISRNNILTKEKMNITENKENKNNNNNINKIEENKEIEDNNDINESELEKELIKKKEEEEKRQQMLIKQKEFIDKLRLKIKEKDIITKLTDSFKNKLSKFENAVLSGISKINLEEIYNQIQLINNRKIISYGDYDILIMKAEYFIREIQSILPDIKSNKNKIFYFLENEINRNKLIESKKENNFDYESKELINHINKELKVKPKIKNEIEKMIYNCSLIDNKIAMISEIRGSLKLFDSKLSLLLFKCRNNINQINEMYKYNKQMMTKTKETELIYNLIKPFIEFYYKTIKELEDKVNNFIKKDEEENIDIFKDKEDNNNIIKHVLNNENNNLEKKLSFDLQDVFEKNNFYFLNDIIIKNHYINLDDDFE